MENGTHYRAILSADTPLIDVRAPVEFQQLLSQADNQPLGPNDRYVYTFDDSAGAHTFNMIARMYSPYGKISAGIVGFTATFDVTYK